MLPSKPTGIVWAPSHTETIFSPGNFKELVKKTSKAVSKLKRRLKFQCLAATGNSGLLLAGAISYKLGMPLLIVRKPGDSCHDTLKVNGYRTNGTCRYLILDDLIASGDTVRRIVKEIDKASAKEIEEEQTKRKTIESSWHPQYWPPKLDIPVPQCVGILLYHQMDKDSWEYTNWEEEQGQAVTVYSVETLSR